MTRGLKFVKLDRDTLKLLIFTNLLFANNKDLLSQIGYILVLANEKNRANIVHWLLIKYKRIMRNILALELYTLTHGYNIEALIKTTINKILQLNLLVILCINSKLLYNCLIKLGTI